MADITTVSFPFCYLCLETDGQLVRPCNNPKCSLRAHNECMKEKSKYGTFHKKTHCEVCTSPIIIEQKKTFNSEKCCISFFKLFYTLFLLIGGSASIVLLALGHTINPYKNGTCVDCSWAVSTFMCLWILPFIAMFWQIPQIHKNGCCRPMAYDIFQYFTTRKIKRKYYFTMLIMYLLSIILVLIAHGIGQLVFKYKFGVYETFNIGTSCAGIMIYYICIAIGLGIFIIVNVSGCIYIYTINKFSNTDITYGVIVDDSNY